MRTSIQFFLILIPTLLFSQKKNVVSVDYGVRLASSTQYFDNYGIFFNDVGFHFINGLFVRVSKKKLAYRFLANYRTPDFFVLPTYEGIDKSIVFTNVKVFDLCAGIQYRPSKQKRCYVFMDAQYASRFKEGYLRNAFGPTFEMINERREFGLGSGLGLTQKIGSLISVSIEGKVSYFFQNASITIVDTFTKGITHNSLSLYRFSASVQLIFSFNTN